MSKQSLEKEAGVPADASGTKRRRFGVKLLQFATTVLWWGLALWLALAVFFTLPLPRWATALLAIGTLAFYAVARGEWNSVWDLFRTPWLLKLKTCAVLAITGLFMVWYLGFVTPDPHIKWSPEQARVPHVEIIGDKVHVRDVRNFTWHSDTEFTEGYYDRVYDLNKLNSMYYVVAPMPGLELVAHVFVSFGFSDGKHVAVSVEGRRPKGVRYRMLSSMFRQYQLIYIVGDERDVVGLRGAIWKIPVHFYPAYTTTERKRAIFLDMMQRAHDLEEEPEFYHLIFNNCMNNITWHLRRLGGRPLPHDIRLLLTGLSDRVAHRYGYFDTDLPWPLARQAFRVDQWMQTTPLDEGFSDRLREQIARQVAEAEASLAR